MRSWKNRLRHRLATSRPTESAVAISSLERPSAANRIILARNTSKYGNVYLRDRLSRIWRSWRDSRIVNGLCLGILAVPLEAFGETIADMRTLGNNNMSPYLWKHST
jgi:hypothetical protein